jgi:hypothetical protein
MKNMDACKHFGIIMKLHESTIKTIDEQVQRQELQQEQKSADL